jgi:hypothetical protein
MLKSQFLRPEFVASIPAAEQSDDDNSTPMGSDTRSATAQIHDIDAIPGANAQEK